jgi:hypothetical protein
MTAQINDPVVFEGRRYWLDCEPLAPWLARKHNRGLRFRRTNTACARGYRSSWEVRNGRLFLTAFAARLANGRFAGIPTLFQAYTPQFIESSGLRQHVSGPREVFAFWCTGVVRCHFGPCLEYEHGGYGSRHAGEIHLHFEGGLLVGQSIVHHEPPAPPRRPALAEIFTPAEIEELEFERALLVRKLPSAQHDGSSRRGAP